MFIDWTYIIIVVPALLLSIWASAHVNRTFKKFSKRSSVCGKTGYDVAKMILEKNGLSDIQVVKTSGNLTDHYDPKRNVIKLSAEVYDGTSMSAIGVAAHECGHAIQLSKNYFPMKIRSVLVPITNIGSRISMPLILLGIVFSFVGSFFINIAYLGVACFSLCVIFQLVTLPVEFNASRRAMAVLKDSGDFSQAELKQSKKVLSAAALTYVAALAVSFAQLLRLFIIVAGNDRRD